MAEFTLTLKDTETQHLKNISRVYNCNTRMSLRACPVELIGDRLNRKNKGECYKKYGNCKKNEICSGKSHDDLLRGFGYFNTNATM